MLFCHTAVIKINKSSSRAKIYLQAKKGYCRNVYQRPTKTKFYLQKNTLVHETILRFINLQDIVSLLKLVKLYCS